MIQVSSDSIKGLKFGYGYMGTHKTFKMRYSLALANAIILRIPSHMSKDMMLRTTEFKGKPYAYIAYIGHTNAYSWQALDTAIKLGKADLLRKQADALTAEAEDLDLPF